MWRLTAQPLSTFNTSIIFRIAALLLSKMQDPSTVQMERKVIKCRWDTGATGAKGDKGDTGATGAKGDKGDTGVTGAKGAKKAMLARQI